MDERWWYDDEYFLRIIERDKGRNPKVVDATITNMSGLIKDDSSNDSGLMTGLQERAREDSSSSDETDSFDDDGIYEDGEPWGHKALTLKQIIGGTPS